METIRRIQFLSFILLMGMVVFSGYQHSPMLFACFSAFQGLIWLAEAWMFIHRHLPGEVILHKKEAPAGWMYLAGNLLLIASLIIPGFFSGQKSIPTEAWIAGTSGLLLLLYDYFSRQKKKRAYASLEGNLLYLNGFSLRRFETDKLKAVSDFADEEWLEIIFENQQAFTLEKKDFDSADLQAFLERLKKEKTVATQLFGNDIRDKMKTDVL